MMAYIPSSIHISILNLKNLVFMGILDQDWHEGNPQVTEHGSQDLF